MKKGFLFLLLGMFFFGGAISCKKEVEASSIQVSREKLIGKWNCTSNDSSFEYFIFTTTNYKIIGKKESNNAEDATSELLYSGTYDIQENKVRLNKLGVIEVNFLSDEVLSFMMTIYTNKNQLRTFFRTEKEN